MKQQKDWTLHQFQELQKKIISEQDLEVFKKTEIIQEILTFIQKMAASIKSKPISATKMNPKFELIQQFFQQLEQKLIDVPPIKQSMRYGNSAFRTWLSAIQPIIEQYCQKQVKKSQEGAVIELKGYLGDSFGNNQRIDYGTGHEFQFLLFLMCLYKLEIFDDSEFEQLVRNVFYKYIELARKVQMTYMLEPAGSHGVWGLDDYQFLPFLLGAAELTHNEFGINPDGIIKQNIITMHKENFMFLQCIDFINTVKKGPFHEHSPILFSMTNVTTWEKVVQGLLKMFQGEVLFKHPVIKHTLFGSLIEYK